MLKEQHCVLHVESKKVATDHGGSVAQDVASKEKKKKRKTNRGSLILSPAI